MICIEWTSNDQYVLKTKKIILKQNLTRLNFISPKHCLVSYVVAFITKFNSKASVVDLIATQCCSLYLSFISHFGKKSITIVNF